MKNQKKADKNSISSPIQWRSIFHKIRFKISLAVALNGLVLMIFSLWLLTDSMNYVEYDLIDSRLATDINYLRDELGATESTEWSERNGALYLGDVLIGDGTPQNANIDRFLHCEDITGTFFYTFVRTYNDDELTWVESGGYQQGHYLRVAGTTKGNNGEDIVGTYIDKKVADKLESSKDGTYSHVANVNGKMIYCRYELLKNNKGKIVGIISDGRSVAEMTQLIRKQKTRGFVLIIAAMFFMNVGLGAIVSSMVGAINKIKAQLKLIGTGVFPEKPLSLKSKDEINDIAESVNEMVESLKEKERIGVELSLATDIQAHMLPSIFPPFPEHDEFDIYATMNPAKEVGGDFYDFFMVDENNLAVVIADVSGKGVPAALFMVITKTLIKNHTQTGLAPDEVFTKVNQMLCEGNESGLFVTAWMGILNIETGNLTYVNAGHNPPMVQLSNSSFSFLKSPSGFVLAGLDGIRYKQNTIQLQPGDKLFLYTDGVTEATNIKTELYGDKRLENYLNDHTEEGVIDILSGLRKNIDQFVGEAEQFDDITMLILNYNKSKGASAMTEHEFEASEKSLKDVMGFVEQELEKIDCPIKISMQITVAVEEIFVNIAHYAYNGQTGKMKLGILYGDDGFVSLRFSDRGLPFNPLAKSDPDISLSAEDRQIGGLGIFMVKKIMDDVQYKYENGQNILTIRKKIIN